MAQELQNGAGADNGSEGAAVVFAAVKPWLVVESPKANDAVQFYKAAFGAEEVSRVNHPKRKAEQEIPLVLSAELKLGSSAIVVSDLIDDASAPMISDSHNRVCEVMHAFVVDIVKSTLLVQVKSVVTGSVFCLETGDVEAAVTKAVAAGAVAEGEISEGEGAFGGGRVGKVMDPYGNVWLICTPSKKGGDVAA
ncbi:early tobacco anther 1 [Striga asiatica]|uniref:Early tobacco anther 1 n=1 Tax=Striga asiatica TaxID=4170 RepID=A0A5A7Q5X4_STRAF|nr:early tobacco anther 1 [Striga asiatica]